MASSFKFSAANLFGAFMGALLLTTPAAWAHHSFAMFDLQKEVTLAGTVADFQWTNPHVWIELGVVENGQPVRYSIEGSSINNLSRAGWKRSTLKPGDKITVVIHPLKSEAKGGSFVRALFSDGRSMTNG
jgi:hypothetical protein